MDGSTVNRLATMAVFLVLLILVLAAGNTKDGHGAGAAAAPGVLLLRVWLNGHGPSDDETSVAVQRHDQSFAGFTDGSGHWHAFPGHENLFPASTTLPFGSSYSDLVGGLANVPGVPLGWKALMQAARVLSAYRPGTDVEPVKRELATVKVMIIDAARLRPIAKTVHSCWPNESRVAAEHLPYIEHWDTMSYEILRSNRTGKWDGPFTKMLETQANIRSQEEALAVVSLIRNANFEQVLKAHATPI